MNISLVLVIIAMVLGIGLAVLFILRYLNK